MLNQFIEIRFSTYQFIKNKPKVSKL